MKRIFLHHIAIVTLAMLFVSCSDIFFRCHEGNGVLGIEYRAVTEFDKVNSEGTFDVNIQYDSSGQSIRVEGDENLLEKVETVVRNNALYISLEDDDCINPVEGLTVYVNVPMLKKVEHDGTGQILISNFNEETLTVEMEGTGEITVNDVVTTNMFEASIAGTGNMSISGKTTNAKYSIDGTGNLTATQMKTSTCNVNISGTGNAYVHAYTRLIVDIDGSGNVYYLGNPEVIPTIDGTGTVEPIE